MSKATQFSDLDEAQADTRYHLLRLLALALAYNDRGLQKLVFEEAEAAKAAALERLRLIEISGGA